MDDPEIDVLAAFGQCDLRIGHIRGVRPNPKARTPAWVLEIDLGPELGIRTSSAQLTEHYDPESLAGRQVVVLCNPPPRRVAGIRSEVLVLAGIDPDSGTHLLDCDRRLPPGTPIA